MGKDNRGSRTRPIIIKVGDHEYDFVRDANGNVVRKIAGSMTKTEKETMKKANSKNRQRGMERLVKSKNNQSEPTTETKRTIGRMPTRDIRKAFELARKGKYGDVINDSRKIALDFVNTVKNARPLSEKPKDVKRSDWLQQNPDLDKALRLLKRETTTMRKNSGKKSEQNVLRMPAPVKYDRETQKIAYKTSDRSAVENTIRAIEKEMNVDLGFALDRIDWID